MEAGRRTNHHRIGSALSQLSGVSDEIVEHARLVKDVPASWNVDWCANSCGDFVFYPPGAQEAAEKQGTPFVIVCSAKCLTEILEARA